MFIENANRNKDYETYTGSLKSIAWKYMALRAIKMEQKSENDTKIKLLPLPSIKNVFVGGVKLSWE